MSKRKSILALILIVISLPLFAMYQSDMRYAGAGEIIPIGSELYDYFDSLFLMSGTGGPSASRPWTAAEARLELSKINASELKGFPLDIYNLIEAALAPHKEYDIFTEISVNPEMYAHSNESFGLEENWNYGYVKRNPFAYIGLNAYHNGFFLHTELTYGISRAGSADRFETLENYVTNKLGKTYSGVGAAEKEYGYPAAGLNKIKVVSFSSIYGSKFTFNAIGPVDNEIPKAAYITYAGKGFSIGAYRSRKTWGRAKIGNFVFDNHIDRYQHISAKIFNRKFAFDFTIMFPEAYLGGNNDVADYGNKRRYFLAHRLDFQISNRLRVAFSENVMYLSTYFADFQYLNPATIYHNNVNGSQFNALAHAEFEYVPIPGLRLYAQLAVDQGSVPFVEDSSREDQAFGCTLGIGYAFELSKGLANINFESVYASPALYRRDAPDFIITNSSQISDSYRSIPYFTYIGFKYGGDTLGLRLDADYRNFNLHLYANQTVLFKGGFGIFDKYEPGMFIGKFLTGNITIHSISNAGLEYSFKIFKRYSCKAFADLSFLYSNSGFDTQLACGIKASLTTR